MPDYAYPSFAGPVESKIVLRDPARLRIAVLGDAHDNLDGMEAILADAASRADVAILLGDAVHRGLLIEWRLFLQRAGNGRWPLPLYPVIGNHDVGFHDNKGSFFRKKFGADNFYWRFGSNMIVALNDVEDDKFSETIEWLSSTLEKESADGDNIVLLLHKPPANEQEIRSISSEMSKELERALEGRKLQMTLAAHNHKFETGSFMGSPLMVTGHSGAYSYGADKEEGYFLLECDPESCQVTPRRVSGLPRRKGLTHYLLVKWYWGWLIVPLLALGAKISRRVAAARENSKVL